MPKLRVFYALIEEYEGQWMLTFPDLPDIKVTADSRSEVVERGDVALQAALADAEVYPGSYEDVSTRPSVKLALQLGKELVAMPG
jgi:predicted RNase H-like HicB family nuclease